MGLHKAKKGLQLPILGAPEQSIADAKPVTRVAVVADDFPGMKPRFLAREGDTIKRGQALFEDRKQPGVIHTAPGAGVISTIHRGERRALQTVVIELSDGERAGSPECQEFESFRQGPPTTQEGIRALLIESGAWTSFRTRPFSHTPAVDASPAAIFVNAMDSNPLALDPKLMLHEHHDAFDAGLQAIGQLTKGPTFLCVEAGSGLGQGLSAQVQTEEFSGPHPSGTSGFHIHTLMPAHRGRVVWTITYQEVIAIGHLMQTGQLFVDRVVSLAGPAAQNPRLVRTRTGASVAELGAGELKVDPSRDARLISGSVFSGRAASETPFAYLGRRDTQVSMIYEASKRQLFGWLEPGADKFSVGGSFISRFFPKKRFDMTTDTHGSARAMVPIGMYEKIMPMDILPTHLLRALLVGDLEMAEKLGALELDEEDVALCSFVCPGKQNYGIVLRSNLERAFAEG